MCDMVTGAPPPPVVETIMDQPLYLDDYLLSYNEFLIFVLF